MMTNNCLDVLSLSKLYRVYRKNFSPLSWATDTLKQLACREIPKSKRPVREILALNNVSFSVKQGESLGVIGPNGAGKSTLLKIMARVTFPTGGRVLGRGRVVPLLEIGTGFSKELSPVENIYLSGALFGIPEGMIKSRMDKILDWAELGDYADMAVARLSSGMYMRLAFSVAVNLEPDILLADEILSVGDMAFKSRCEERLKELTKNGMTLLLVSHDMQAISQMTSRAIFLSQGSLIADGEPDNIIQQYEQYSVQQARTRIITNDEKVASNEYCSILEPAITSADRTVKGILTINEDSWLKVPFEVFEAHLRYTVNIDLYHHGIVLFGTRGMPIQADRVGMYVAWIKIPAQLLVDDVYVINISVMCEDDGIWHVAKMSNAISVPLLDPEDRFQKLREIGLKIPRNWVIDPRLHTEYEYIGQMETV